MKTINYKNRLRSLYKQWYFNTTEYIPFNREVTVKYIHEASVYINHLLDLPESLLAILFEKYPTIAPLLTKGLDKVEDKFGKDSVIRNNKFRGILNETKIKDYFKNAMDEIVINELEITNSADLQVVMKAIGIDNIDKYKEYNTAILDKIDEVTKELRNNIPTDFNNEHTANMNIFIKEELGVNLDSGSSK